MDVELSYPVEPGLIGEYERFLVDYDIQPSPKALSIFESMTKIEDFRLSSDEDDTDDELNADIARAIRESAEDEAWREAGLLNDELELKAKAKGAVFDWADPKKSAPAPSVSVPTTRVVATPEEAGVGIRNDGNTCYFNGSMQAFANIPVFIATLDQMSRETDGQTPTCIRFLRELQQLMHRLRDNTTGSPTTGTACMTALRNLLEVQSKYAALHNFRAGEMNDASELMRYVVDELQECTHPAVMRGGKKVTWTPLPEFKEEERLKFNPTESGIREINAAYELARSRVNMLTDLFMTFYVETVTYLPNAAGAEIVPGMNPTTEIYMAVKLPKIHTVGAQWPTDINLYTEYSSYLRSKGLDDDNATPKTLLDFQRYMAPSLPVTLEDCLEDYFSREKITDANPEEFAIDTKQISIWQLPQILMLTLTREGFVKLSDAYVGADGTKVQAAGELFVDKRPVLFSRTEPLDMRPYIHPNSPVIQQGLPTTYTLRSVVIRRGENQTSGHVTAMCKTGDRWAYYDDDKVVRGTAPPPRGEGAWKQAFGISVDTSAQVLVYVRD